ncbi:MAG: hypothetical protein F8N36_14065 [Desulfovibrio sp.]|uniref:hypothetical protein n=1 Tax=Desulfovibrio sp. TaxID=885 RepID=UPI00135D8CB7|nr:hypothetical protein [Desulfovibrio sp.]MTJ93964.1 hypothetical protein [Desulfovibrio sp.]
MAQSPIPARSPGNNRRPKRSREAIEGRLDRAAKNTSMYSMNYLPVLLKLQTAFTQNMGEKFFYKRTVDGFHNVDVVLRLIGKDQNLVDGLAADLKKEAAELLEAAHAAREKALARVKDAKALLTKVTHPHEAEYRATTPMAMKYLTAIQHVDDTAAALAALYMSEQITSSEMLAEINQLTGQIASLSIKVIQMSRTLRKIAEKTEGVDTSLLGEEDTAPLPGEPAAPVPTPARAGRSERSARRSEPVTGQVLETAAAQ